MMPSISKLSLVLTATLFAIGPNSFAQQPTERPPNVVFFLVDDLGWRDVGCFGSEFYETPHIDRLASEGVRFNQAYATCHVCSPTRASILTGKYPARLHLTDWLPGRREFPFQQFKNAEIHQHLPYEETTIAEVLKAKGYSTAIFAKSPRAQPNTVSMFKCLSGIRDGQRPAITHLSRWMVSAIPTAIILPID